VASKHRCIIEDKQFARDVAQLSNPQSLDEALDAVKWALARRPEEAGHETGYPGVRAIATRPLRGIPSLVIYYCFDAEQVTLLSARGAEGDEDE